MSMRAIRSGHIRTGGQRIQPQLLCEPLEHRLLLAFISWINRGGPIAGDTDRFVAAYGDKAADARQIVDVAIADWSYAIQNFNYADKSHPNELQIHLSAGPDFGSGPYGVTSAILTDSEKKPYRASIVLNTLANINYFIPHTFQGTGAFTSATDYAGTYSSSPTFRPPIDFYTTVLHEIGHAVGLDVGETNLRISEFLTPVAGSTTLFDFNAGPASDPTIAQFTSEGGGHIAGVEDLMNQFQPDRRRRMITPLDARILRDAYGFTIWEPTTELPKLGELPVYSEQFCSYFHHPGFDDDGNELGCVAQTISVAPTVDAISDQIVDEGSLLSLKAEARSPNPGIPFIFSLAPGAPSGASIDSQTGAFSWTPPDGAATQSITVRGSDGATFGSETFTVTVNNVAPTASLNGPAIGVRGQLVGFTLSADDPSSADEAAGFTYSVDWGDGTSVQTIGPAANNGAAALAQHAFVQNGPYTVRVTATDKDGAPSGEVSHSITIASTAVLPDPANSNATAFFLGGTSGNDAIVVTPKGILIGGVNTAIPAGVARLVFYGQDGDDHIYVNGSMILPVIIDGGAGNDRIKGAGGDDILIGGPDDDELKGLDGRDILIGGLGSDKLYGQQHDDVLIAGATVHDSNLAALSMLMAEWSRLDLASAPRADHLINGGPGALNGSILLDALSLIDDGVPDDLVGGPGDNLLL